MITVITGHTYGVGRALYNHFPNAVGLARSNGYDIEKDFDRIVDSIRGCDLFINNAYANHSQVKLFNAVKDHVGKIVCMGSIARLYRDILPSQYADNKQELYDTVRLHNLKQGSCPALHLDISFMQKESFDNPNIVQVNDCITYEQVVDVVDYWLSNPVFTNVEFSWKMSTDLQQELNRVYGIDV